MMAYSLVTSHICWRILKWLVFVKYVAKNRRSVIRSVMPITGKNRFGTPICKVYAALMRRPDQSREKRSAPVAFVRDL